MVDWEITATTIFCEAVDDEVTVIVSQDGTVKCTGRQKYAKPTRETAKEIKNKSVQLGKQINCVGDQCSRVTQCRDSLLSKK